MPWLLNALNVEQKNTTDKHPQPSKRYRCGKCGAEIILLQNTDTHAGFPPKLARPKPTTLMAENTSGQGKLAVVPQEIRGWNWGAFLLGLIWGAGNNVWWSLLLFIPYFNILWTFVMGIKGSEWAWRSKRWESIEHFKGTQATWTKWGVVLFVVPFALFFWLVALLSW